MEEKIEKILNFMRDENYVPMKAKEMASLLMVPKNDHMKFQEVLSKLESDMKIQKNRKNQYILVEEKYIEGIYKSQANGFGFVLPIHSELEEIYIAKENSKNCFSNDVVLVQIIKEKQDGFHAEGRVVKIKKHEKDTLVGTFEKSRNFGFVVADDKKIAEDIFISKKNFGGAKNQDKVVVKITKYPEKNKKAEGKIIEVLGNINQAGVDMLSLVKEYKLPYEFPEPVLEEARKIESKPSKEEIEKRVDFRKKAIYTIDGETAKDLDDAIWVGKSENGNYLLDVHIADVSHYVKEDSLLDKEALQRGTSIYMLDRVIPMLPKELSNGICSLNAGEDRLTLSCSMEIDPKGNVISSDIYKAVICVKKRMSYTQVQKILDEEDEEILTEYKEDIENFKLMAELAQILKEKRQEKGYLNLDIPESQVILDDKGYAIDVMQYETTFAHEIIEQFMLLANEIVAERFYWLEAPFIYRVHEDPDIEKVEELNKFLYNFGYKIKVKEDKVYPKEFAKILEEVKGTEQEKIISNFILHTLKVARYEAENKGHFGIASNYYCHFTSPIRRYPDLFIHRIISKYLSSEYNLKEEEKEKYDHEAEEYAKQSSEREKIATKVERDSIDIKKAEYMSKKIGEEFEGMVSNVTSFGMFVELENTIEGLIRFENLGDDYYNYDDQHKILIGERTGNIFRIGDKIKVRLIEANKTLRRISFQWIEENQKEE